MTRVMTQLGTLGNPCDGQLSKAAQQHGFNAPTIGHCCSVYGCLYKLTLTTSLHTLRPEFAMKAVLAMPAHL